MNISIMRRDEKPDPEQSEGAVLRNEVTNGNPCLSAFGPP